MQVVYERCAGIDVHQRMVVVTVLLMHPTHVEKHYADVWDHDGGSARAK